MRTIILSAALLLAASSAQAQRLMTAEQAVNDALQNNVRMKNADNDLEAARQAKKQAFTKYFPTVSATGIGYMADKGLLEMSLAPGMEMSMLKNGIMGGVSAQMPLFTGGRILNANRLADISVEMSRQQRRMSHNEVVLTAETYFWQAVMLKEKLKTVEAVERQLDKFAKDADATVAAGVSDRNDLLQVNLRKNETRSNRITLENALTTAKRLLAQYTGHDGDSIDVSADMSGGLPPSPLQLYAEPQTALANTAEYALMEQNVKANRLKYKMTVGQNLPTVAIGGGYMYDDLMDKSHSFWLGFATVSIPLTGWWGGSHEMKKQRLAVRNAENTLQDNSQLLVIGMENKWNDMNDAYRKIGIAIESIAQAEENLRLHDDYYRAGTATMSDLLEAQTLYQNSRSAYVEAYAEYQIKKREYLQATGQ
mgnify:CR=1 FL=1